MKLLASIKAKAIAYYKLWLLNQKSFVLNSVRPEHRFERIACVSEAIDILMELAVTEYVDGINGEYNAANEYTHRSRIEALKWVKEQIEIDETQVRAWESRAAEEK